MRVVLYQPDIPQNLGSCLRLAACFGVALHVVEPCGFPLDDKKVKRVAMDYGAQAELVRHASWESFQQQRQDGRLLLLSSKNAVRYTEFAFAPGDWLLFGRESAGVPDAVREAADAGLIIPMRPGLRSLNLAVSAGIVLAEAVRQTGGFGAAG